MNEGMNEWSSARNSAVLHQYGAATFLVPFQFLYGLWLLAQIEVAQMQYFHYVRQSLQYASVLLF